MQQCTFRTTWIRALYKL